jgi:hypothetical protein
MQREFSEIQLSSFDTFLESYKPSSKIEANEQLTTSEILAIFDTFSPSILNEPELVQLMHDNGYLKTIKDGNFIWLVKKI